MNRLLIAGLALAAVLVGCTPEAMTTATVDTMSIIFVYKGDQVSIYKLGEEQHAFLKGEFDAWKTAGFDDFTESFLKRPPSLRITGTTANGVAYKIDLHDDLIIITEISSDMVDGTRYARELTPADKRLRMFLQTCIATGALPKLASGKVPTNE